MGQTIQLFINLGRLSILRSSYIDSTTKTTRRNLVQLKGFQLLWSYQYIFRVVMSYYHSGLDGEGKENSIPRILVPEKLFTFSRLLMYAFGCVWLIFIHSSMYSHRVSSIVLSVWLCSWSLRDHLGSLGNLGTSFCFSLLVGSLYSVDPWLSVCILLYLYRILSLWTLR